jgi:CHAT domain-containing protein
MNSLLQLSELDHHHLLICAVPNWFDGRLLQALMVHEPLDANALERLLKLPVIQLSHETEQRYMLEPGLRQELLVELKNEQRLFYKSLHEIAFYHFVDRLLYASPETKLTVEVELLFHIDALFIEYIYANELPLLAALLVRVTTIPLQEPAHHHVINYYQGCLFNEQGQLMAAHQKFLAVLGANALPTPLKAKTLTALGVNYEFQGLWDRAIDAHQQSQQLSASINDVLGQAKALLNMGIIYHQMADYQHALALFQASYQHFCQLADLSRQRLALNELGYTAKELGQLEDALDYYHRSLAICRQLGLHEFEGRLYNNLGEIYHLQCQWTEAYDSYMQALTIARDSRYDRKRDATDILLNLGFLFHTQAQLTAAKSYYQQAFALAQTLNHQTALSQYYYLMGDLDERAGDLAGAQQLYENAIAIVEAMRINVSSEETRIGLLGIRQYVYHAMVLLCLKQAQPALALMYIERAKSRAFLDQLGAANAEGANTAEMPLTTQEIQQRLSAQEALIEYFYTGAHGSNQTLLANLPEQSEQLRPYLAPANHLFAFIVTQQTVQVIELSAKVQRIQAQLFDQQDGRLLGVVPIPGQPLPVLRRWQGVGQQIVNPLLPYLQGKTTLFLIPHGILHYLPLHALLATTTQPWLPPVIYAPSASILLKTRALSPRPCANGRCLSIGVDTGGLAHAEAEASWISAQLAGTTLIGDQATVAAVTAAMAHHSLIHFAGHGHFRRSVPMASGLTLADGELSAATIWQSLKINATLVTLSACDTGLHHLGQGDELFGLMRALLKAGAQSLLVTLWPVHELSARLFMEAFYQHWLASASAPVALAAAQQAIQRMTYSVLQNKLNAYQLLPAVMDNHLHTLSTMFPGDYPFTHPYYWAGFVLIGCAD